MGTLKSAYEIACERKIKSPFGDQIAAQQAQVLKQEKKRKEKLPDFMREWEDLIDKVEGLNEKEGEETNMGSVMIEDQKSKLYTIEEIRQTREGKAEAAPSYVYEPVENSPSLSQETKTFDDLPEVHWYGHFTSYTGFSRMNRAMTFGLSNLGVKVKADVQGSSVEINESTHNVIKKLENNKISETAPKVFGATVPLKMFHAGHRILYTMMETSNTLHPEYVDKLNYFNEIWVPTFQGRELFKENGVHPPIFVMPLGVDVDRYNLNQKPYTFPFPIKEFIFVSVFKWGLRKGYDALLQSYIEEFTADDDTTLLIVSRVHSPHEKGKIMEEVKSLISSYKIPSNKLPHIALMDSEIPERDMPRIYRASNAFILLSRGEGFGLPYYEAAACGLPVIGTNCSGQSDLFSSAEGGFMVEPDLMIQAKINGPMSGLAKHCKFYEDQYFPSFGRKAIDQTKEHMRNIYTNYDDAIEKADTLTQWVLNNCSWDIAVKNVYERIVELN